MMAQASRGLLFRKRTILGGALIAGIGLGVWLGLPFKGFLGLGHGSADGSAQNESQSSSGKLDSTSNEPASAFTGGDQLPTVVPNVVKVLIDEREFLLRQTDEDVPITLSNLIHLTKQAPGDADGVRIRIYEKSTARASAEENLKQGLVDAGIPDSAVFWVPTPVKDFDTRRANPSKSK